MEKKQIIISGAVIVVIVALAIWQMNQGEESADMDAGSAPTVEQNDRKENNQKIIESAYADGTYAAMGTYTSPAGEEEVEVTLTIEEGVVTAAEFKGFAENPGSVNKQAAFAEGFEEEVVGKSIDEIDLTVVNGSSLTPIGFEDALEKIKEEASQEV